jgi:hypothetical protein
VTLDRRAWCGRGCAALAARVTMAEEVLAGARDAGLRAPFHVQFRHVPSYWTDAGAREVLGRWGALLPAGSSVALSVSVGGAPGALRPGDMLRDFGQVQPHTARAVRSWLAGAGFTVAEPPGVTSVLTWPVAVAEGAAGVSRGWRIAGVVAVKG